MNKSLNILILAGSSEARQIALALRGQGRAVTAWLSEPPRGVNPMPVPYHLRPFDDATQLQADMVAFDVVLDASHGFDARMSAAGFAAATACDLPFLSFQRDGWPLDHPLLRAVPDVATAARAVRPGARVFSATGWASLPDFEGFAGARLMLRQTSPHDRRPAYDFVDLIFGDPPFTVASETALFRALAVDQLICRNLGGAASRPKVDAAIALGREVILIERPPLPDGAAWVNDTRAVLDWVAVL